MYSLSLVRWLTLEGLFFLKSDWLSGSFVSVVVLSPEMHSYKIIHDCRIVTEFWFHTIFTWATPLQLDQNFGTQDLLVQGVEAVVSLFVIWERLLVV